MYQISNPTLTTLLVDTVWARRDRLVDIADKNFRIPTSDFFYVHNTEVVAQWVDGFIALLIEELKGGSGEFRRFYIERLVPDLAADGLAPSVLFRMVIAWSIITTDELTRPLPETYRTEAVRWFSIFFAGYIDDISRVIRGEPLYSKPSPNLDPIPT